MGRKLSRQKERKWNLRWIKLRVDFSRYSSSFFVSLACGHPHIYLQQWSQYRASPVPDWKRKTRHDMQIVFQSSDECSSKHVARRSCMTNCADSAISPKTKRRAKVKLLFFLCLLFGEMLKENSCNIQQVGV